MPQPAPGRSCGDCNACCRYYDLMRDFKKPQGILCQHWQAGTGCGIHAVRPAICRDFYCHWLMDPQFGDDWRPDRCGIIIRDTLDNIPPHWPLRQGLTFDLHGPDTAIDDEQFLRLVAANIAMGVPLFLSVHGPMGFGNMNAFLNEVLAPAVAAMDGERLRDALRAILRDLRAA